VNNLPSCVQAGIGNANPSYSVVGLYSDFGDDKLTNLAVSNIAQLTNIVPQNIEIIVVLNDPTDKLMGALKKFDRLIVLTTNKNLGCVVKNIGYQIAQGDYIFSIDHDVFVKNSYAFTKCIDFLNNNPNSALVGPCGGNIVDKYWTQTSWGVGEQDNKKHIFGYDDPVDFGINESVDGTPVDTIPSMFWCFRRKLLQEIGYLDWRFGPFVGSDTDFCFRIKEKGHSVNVIRVPMNHIGGGACSHKKQPFLKLVLENHLKELYDKWFSKKNIICENYKNEIT